MIAMFFGSNVHFSKSQFHESYMLHEDLENRLHRLMRNDMLLRHTGHTACNMPCDVFFTSTCCRLLEHLTSVTNIAAKGLVVISVESLQFGSCFISDTQPAVTSSHPEIVDVKRAVEDRWTRKR